MLNKKIISINGTRCEIGGTLTFHPVFSDKYMTRYKFFEARDLYRGCFKIAANYGKYWAIGENFYDASDNLEAKMFAANRTKFIKIIDLKTKSKTK